MEAHKRYFGTDGVRGVFGVEPITPSFAWQLGWAIGELFKEHRALRVIIGRDTRTSSRLLESFLVAGLRTKPVALTCLGIVPTPTLAYLMSDQYKVGIVITASHNPSTDNGFKLFYEGATKLDTEMQIRLEEKIAIAPNTATPAKVQAFHGRKEKIQQYIKFCLSTMPSSFSLRGKKIVLDCAQGSTYEIAPQVFKALNAALIVIGNQPNGLNINKGYGTTQLTRLKETVLAEKADIGIAFDGDGDRVLMVDHLGTPCDGDDLLFILAKAQHLPKKSTVIGTVMSNAGLATALSQLGVQLLRTPVGDQHIQDALQQTGSMLGAEPSGHIICKDYTATADGLIAALQVLVALRDTALCSAHLGLYKVPQSRIDVPHSQPLLVLKDQRVKEAITKAQKMLKTQGRLLVRASGTEPYIRIMAEGKDESSTQAIAEELASIIRSTHGEL